MGLQAPDKGIRGQARQENQFIIPPQADKFQFMIFYLWIPDCGSYPLPKACRGREAGVEDKGEKIWKAA
jgi:hypothetical protein